MQDDYQVELAALEAVGGVDGDAVLAAGRQDGADGLGLVAVCGANRDTSRGDGDTCHCSFGIRGKRDGTAVEGTRGDGGAGGDGVRVGAEGVPGGKLVEGPAGGGGDLQGAIEGVAAERGGGELQAALAGVAAARKPVNG